MASITYWTRLDPHSRTAQLQAGLQATLHDPLWLLARQWQLGEFQAEDAGTPIMAQLRGHQSSLARYHAGPLGTEANTGQPYPHQVPLEVLVEAEPLSQTFHPARAAEAGLHFCRWLQIHGVGHYRGAYQAQYPLPDDNHYRDPASQRYLQVVQGRVLNGHQLYDAVVPPQPGAAPVLPENPAIAPADQAAVLQAITDWLSWYQQRFKEPAAATAWQSDRMEHHFAVSAPAAHGDGEIVFVAPEYPGGQLDWYAFNQRSKASLGLDSESAAAHPLVRTVMPAPVSFPGMPQSRWWTFADTAFSLNSLETGPEDLGRMLLLHFALTYSDDWFLMPVELDVGSVLQIDSLVVSDTFGVRTLVNAFGDVDGAAGAWRLFTHTLENSDTGPRGDQLFIPPTLVSSLHSQPVEEVLLLRDEMANLAWAVETQVENARGQASRRHQTALAESAPAPVPPAADADLAYALMSDVPEHWIPLVPGLASNNQDLQFRRGQLLKYRDGSRVELPAQGQLLTPGVALSLEAEEIDRAGACLTRAYQHSRWLDGTPYLWMARRKRPGRGQGWSGLRYDLIEPIIEPSSEATP